MTSKEERQRRIDEIKKGMKNAESWQVTKKRLIYGACGVACVVAISAIAYYYLTPPPITDDDFITVQDELWDYTPTFLHFTVSLNLRMSQLLISLPPGTQFDQFTPLQLKHPKGQTVTFLAREDKLYELNHRKVETNMCFSTMNDKTTSKSHFVLTLAENIFFKFNNPP